VPCLGTVIHAVIMKGHKVFSKLFCMTQSYFKKQI